jgi:transcriptional regulator with XRE-family HTH domain
MELRTIGNLIAGRRRELRLTLSDLASRARVGRSTLAALESGKLAELGLGRVARLCREVGLVLEARPMHLEQPLMVHRHLTEAAGRELTKAAIEDVISNGNIDAWRGLVRAMHTDKTGAVTRRVRELSAAIRAQDEKTEAFAALLPGLLHPPRRTGAPR